MFSVRVHDFGAVARGSKQQFTFELENKYEEDVHVASVRSSCGCTSPSVGKRTLKTWEKSEIVATFNTRSFLGQKGATITVVIDRPYYAEVQLRVDGYIRSDVVLDPGAVTFGEVEGAVGAERKVAISYRGRGDWRILDVVSTNKSFEVELDETARAGDRVEYEMVVRVRPGAPEGFFQDQLTLVTDDRRNARLAVPVEGKVKPAVTVFPKVVSFVVNEGDEATKKLVIRGKAPFKILGVECDGGDCLKFETSSEARKVHFIPVTFHAKQKTEALEHQVRIRTDVGEELVVTCQVTAIVR
jgi:hypothetical protein